jgi:hypothetical protein
MKRTTIFLPEELHERLRADAFRNKISMAELIRARLQRPAARPRARVSPRDPLLKVAGVCRGPILSEKINESLYGR